MRKVRIIAFILVILISSGCTNKKQENVKIDQTLIKTSKTIECLFGFRVEVVTTRYPNGWCENIYYGFMNDGKKQVIAESFGLADNDYMVDIDGDEAQELICNCIFGGDGHKKVYVYRFNKEQGTVERGTFNPELAKIDNWNNWGTNSMNEHYDQSKGTLVIEYSTNSNENIDTTILEIDNEAILNLLSFEVYVYKNILE